MNDEMMRLMGWLYRGFELRVPVVPTWGGSPTYPPVSRRLQGEGGPGGPPAPSFPTSCAGEPPPADPPHTWARAVDGPGWYCLDCTRAPGEPGVCPGPAQPVGREGGA